MKMRSPKLQRKTKKAKDDFHGGHGYVELEEPWEVELRGKLVGDKWTLLLLPEILALKHESRILGQWSNPVCGTSKSQASSPWAKQHRAKPVASWRNHIQGQMNVRESYSLALE